MKEMKGKLADAQAQAKEAKDAAKAAESRANALEKKLACIKDAPPPTQTFSKPKDNGKGKAKVRRTPP